jgi:ubiquinone/menaquinone biosynthesis C-methylase UbiE
MTKFYDTAMKRMESACLSKWRAELLSGISGKILEIGSGTGANLPFYQGSAARFCLSEPDPHMLSLLKRKIHERHDDKFTVLDSPAENLNLPDNSFDAVVTTLVLCSVSSIEAALKEVRRVLRTGGKLYFIEHVLAKDEPRLMKRQKLIQPLWRLISGNCHPTRDTERYIIDAGLEFEILKKSRAIAAPSIVSPTIKGVARNPR